MLISRARWFLIVIVAAMVVTAFTARALMKGSGRRANISANSPARVNNPKVKAYNALFVDKKDEKDSRAGGPRELRLQKAHPFDGDLRKLPYRKPVRKWRPEREPPHRVLQIYPGTTTPAQPSAQTQMAVPTPAAPAPTPNISFDGLDFANWGAGHPPDENGDVGPTYYIQTVNTSIGIYNKSTGVRVAAFTFDTFMSQGSFGNLCDTDNFGDPVVLYDTFEDRWFITDFAFQLDGSNNVINPPGSFQCIAVSKTGDPVAGGWNFYSINTTGGLGDYPKFGIWPDGIYMSANMFDYAAGGSFQNVRVFAFNKAQMYAAAPTPQVVSFDVADASEFTLLPSNARLQAGTPPPGSPNYFISTSEFLNAQDVYKFHVDWNSISLSTFTGPFNPLASSSWPAASVPNAPTPGNFLDVLQQRAMAQNQYTNLSGVESLWATHTVRRQDTAGFAAPRWYQVPVTGGTVGANDIQSVTWDPDGANVIHRYVPSLAVDRAGNMAIGYTTSNSTTNPGIKYAGRLSTDPVNTFSQTEQTLIQGTGTQTGSCGGTCTRWGDYTAMTLDPDGCTFWYTNEYYAVNGLNDLTRIGSFKFAACTPVGSGGTVSGTVTRASDSSAISGATVALGVRTTTTNGSGFYSFTGIPAGTYPNISASKAGFNSSTATSIVVTDSMTTTQNFSLTSAATSGCLTDTTQADFQMGVATNADLTTSSGDVILLSPANIDQQNTTLGSFGVGINTTTWGGQTFTAAITGQLVKADINLFCSGCTGTTPNLTLSIRATSGGLPTGADLATATIAGFSNGAAVYYTGTFGSPATLTSGTQYALVIRPNSTPSAGTYALTRSGTSGAGADVYAGGSRVSSANSGSTWSIPTTGGVTTDAGFKTYMKNGFASSGDFVSSSKDANPAVGFTATWTTLSWTASTPVNTTLKFQAAASNSVYGPFTFVGPNGTAATFFTVSGASLSQFNGFRYLKYKAYLSTTNSSLTPTLNDVTICFNDAQTLRIDTVAPPAGRTSGGQQIILSGAFGGLSTVTMGGSAASFVYTNGAGDTSQITLTTPPHAVGAVNIVLTPTSGSPLTKTNAFAYLPTVFTDNTITVGQTTAKAQHIVELRQAVDAMRAVAGLTGAPWTDPALAPGDTIRAIHILDLRTYLDDAATRLGYSTSPYTDPGLTSGFVIKRIHIEELRQRIRTIAG
ncbi:MAG TPA: carboxypeptidase-like regulatory domain-containing protein [Pyrinomonadaceae bacterium]|nr:carboxypeptidase-like regulatory domain-containing protein [Pyrinomonadaceae bacterium]